MQPSIKERAAVHREEAGTDPVALEDGNDKFRDVAEITGIAPPPPTPEQHQERLDWAHYEKTMMRMVTLMRGVGGLGLENASCISRELCMQGFIVGVPPETARKNRMPR